MTPHTLTLHVLELDALEARIAVLAHRFGATDPDVVDLRQRVQRERAAVREYLAAVRDVVAARDVRIH